MSRLPPELVTLVIEFGCKPTINPRSTWKHYYDASDRNLYELGSIYSWYPDQAKEFIQSCSLVCKEWSGAALRILYRKIMFSTRKKINHFCRCSKQAEANRKLVKAISLEFLKNGKGKAHSIPKIMKRLLNGLDNLTMLRIYTSHTLFDTEDQWRPVLKVIGDSVPHITTLHIGGPDVNNIAGLDCITGPVFEDFLGSLPHLTSLAINVALLCLMKLHQDHHTDSGESYTSYSQVLTQLRSLSINGQILGCIAWESSGFHFERICDILSSSSLSNLSSFTWTAYGDLSWNSPPLHCIPENGNGIFCSGPNLLSLRVNVSNFFPESAFGAMLQNQCPNLVECSLRCESGQGVVSAHYSRSMTALPPSIRFLELDFSEAKTNYEKPELVSAAILGKLTASEMMDKGIEGEGRVAGIYLPNLENLLVTLETLFGFESENCIRLSVMLGIRLQVVDHS